MNHFTYNFDGGGATLFVLYPGFWTMKNWDFLSDEDDEDYDDNDDNNNLDKDNHKHNKNIGIDAIIRTLREVEWPVVYGI